MRIFISTGKSKGKITKGMFTCVIRLDSKGKVKILPLFSDQEIGELPEKMVDDIVKFIKENS